MWIKVIVWYKKSGSEDERVFEKLGIDISDPYETKYNPEQEGEMLINTDKIIRINPSADNPEYSVLWLSEDPPQTIHVKHSLNHLQDVLRTGPYYELS